MQRCDVGIYVGQDSCPLVRDNGVDGSLFAGVFAEAGARANVLGNKFNGGTARPLGRGGGGGFGLLWLNGAAGIVGKNHFEHYEVSPVMIFSQCHPLVKDNTYDNICVDDAKQEVVEKTMLDRFNAELFKQDHHFYIIDSQSTEKSLQHVILKGQSDDTT